MQSDTSSQSPRPTDDAFASQPPRIYVNASDLSRKDIGELFQRVQQWLKASRYKPDLSEISPIRKVVLLSVGCGTTCGVVLHSYFQKIELEKKMKPIKFPRLTSVLVGVFLSVPPED
jgi:hypothetical protein